MIQNQYVQLSTRSLQSLCDLAAALPGAHRFDYVAEVLSEARRLWERLAWSDRTLNEHECAVFDAVVQVAASRGGYRLAAIDIEEAMEAGKIPEFLRIAALSEDGGPRLAGRMINHLETFGYGVLAADRQIHEVELASLQNYIEGLRKAVEAARSANRLALAAV